MQPRMRNPAQVLDGATNAIFGRINATQQTDGLFRIVTTNPFNRLNASTRQAAGSCG